MTSKYFATVCGALAVTVVLAVPPNAAEPNARVAPTGEREYGAKLLVCATCHGAGGVPQNPTIPVIWGQQENYLLKQLHDFDSGDRAFEPMAWMVSTLSQSEMASAAAYFAKKSWPARSAGAASATAPPLMSVCQACHQQNFVGGVSAPRLAGQSYQYLVESMRSYADGERTNNPEMANIMQALSSAEREAMARYISNF